MTERSCSLKKPLHFNMDLNRDPVPPRLAGIAARDGSPALRHTAMGDALKLEDMGTRRVVLYMRAFVPSLQASQPCSLGHRKEPEMEKTNCSWSQKT